MGESPNDDYARAYNALFKKNLAQKPMNCSIWCNQVEQITRDNRKSQKGAKTVKTSVKITLKTLLNHRIVIDYTGWSKKPDCF